MGKTSKPTLIEERHFPFECSDSYGVEEGYHKLHWHQEIEICYIKQGTGKYLINGVDYPFSAGDIIIISNDDIHLCHDDKDLIMQVMMFDPFLIGSGSVNPFDFEYTRLFINSSCHLYKKIDHTVPDAGLFVDILTEIEIEYHNQKNGYEMMIKSLLLRFFALIIRCFSENSESSNTISLNAREKICDILQFMEKHYAKNITLSVLEEKFEISRPYLCSSFKALTGISPIDYMIQKRITEAKRMLIATDKSILNISEACGFHSLSNFNSTFKRLVGCTPSVYRKQGI